MFLPLRFGRRTSGRTEDARLRRMRSGTPREAKQEFRKISLRRKALRSPERIAAESLSRACILHPQCARAVQCTLARCEGQSEARRVQERGVERRPTRKLQYKPSNRSGAWMYKGCCPKLQENATVYTKRKCGIVARRQDSSRPDQSSLASLLLLRIHLAFVVVIASSLLCRFANAISAGLRPSDVTL